MRLRKGLTTTHLAAKANLSRQHVWRLEKGLVRDPGGDALGKLAAALGVGVSELLPEVSARESVLHTLARKASRIKDEDWFFIENLCERLSRPDYADSKRPASRQVRLGGTDGKSADLPEETRPGFEVPDDIKVIAQFFAAREKAPTSWQRFTREAFELRRELKTRGHYPRKAAA
jgi:transcriptional regulator with XRE-family HTH domain